MSSKNKLSRLCNYFFISGFFLGKVQSLPLPLISTFFSTLSLICYGSGYSIWFISSHYYPNQSNTNKEWLLQFKNQQLYAAVLGLIATILSVAAIFVPPLLIPAAWVFLMSNTLWFLDEYHKLKSPPLTEKNYSHAYQKTYTAYAGLITGVSLIGAVSATCITLFPLAALPLFVVSGTLAVTLGILSVAVLANYYLGPHSPPISNKSSTSKMNLSLEVSPNPKKPQEKEALSPPYQGKNILSSKVQIPENKLEEPISPPSTPGSFNFR